MAYSDFTSLEKAKATLGITIHDRPHLFADIPPMSPSDFLKTILDENLTLASAIITEKARSELLITPILLELKLTKFWGFCPFHFVLNHSSQPK